MRRSIPLSTGVAAAAVVLVGLCCAGCRSSADQAASASTASESPIPVDASAPGSRAGQTSSPAGEDTPPMTEFIDALQKGDREHFMKFFSRTRPWRYVSTITDPPQESEVEFAELESDLRNRTGWYETLFDADGDDCFRDWVQGSEGRSWKPSGANRFVRYTVDGKDSVYVEWRKEAGFWVISVIAEPSA